MAEDLEDGDVQPTQQEMQDMVALRAACLYVLGHQFDSVQIVATRMDAEAEGTVMASWGEGNIYAREGSVREWLRNQGRR